MSLAWKIASLAALLVVAATLALFVLVQNAIEGTVVHREEERLSRATTLAAQEFRSDLDGAIADVRVAAAVPSVAGAAQSILDSKQDFASESAIDGWQARVARYFRALLAANPTYLQIRLIGAADDGREVVKVARTAGRIVRATESTLQRKGDRAYFKETVTQGPGVVHVSRINLNRERGRIEVPHRPVVRVGSVVTTDSGEVFGIVVINVDFSQVLGQLTSLSADALSLYMTTAQGDYIVAPDAAREFGFERGRRYLIQKDLPWLGEGYQGDALLGRSRAFRAGDMLTRTQTVSAGEGNLQQTWVFVATLDLKHAAADFLYFRYWLIGAVLVLIALGTLVAVFFARRITAPLHHLTAALRTVGEGSFDVDLDGSTAADAELRDVKSAFETMRDAVKSREQGLRDAEARMSAIVENTVNPIITIDERGTILHVNAATSRMFGYTADELEGKNVGLLMPAPYRKAHDGYIQRYLKTGEAHILGSVREVEAQRKDGTIVPVDLGVAEVMLATGRTFVSSLTDLTQVKKLEKIRLEKIQGALKLEKMKGEFVATVSHELRTPLTSIKGCLALLATDRLGALPEKAKSMIEIAHTNSERLGRLINDILDLEKIKTGQMTFAMQQVSVAGLLQDAVRANTAYSEQFGVTLEIAPVADGLSVHADPDRAAQALTNLISNAVKYSPKGRAVTLSAERRKDIVRISVRDRGPGIPEEFRNQIFDRFAQADSTDARRKGGTGLGLSITKAIAEAHGGAIGYRTRKGKGTTFYVDLPIGTGAQTEAPADKPRILICEDDPEMALLLRTIIEAAGYRGRICNTVAETRDLLDKEEFAAMTLDLTLPDGDGTTLLRELRRTPKHESLPVIVVSGTATAGKKTLSSSAFRFVDWLDKPLDPDRLRASIERALDGTGEAPTSVLHVEDDRDYRALVADVLGDTARITPAGSLQEAVELLQTHVYDMVILDLVLPDGSGERLLTHLNNLKGAAAPAVLVYSIRELPATLASYVDGALVKSHTDSITLRRHIHRVAKEKRRKTQVHAAAE